MEKSFMPPPDGVNTSANTIEASMEMVKKTRRRKRRCKAPTAKPISSPKSDRVSLRTIRTVSSLKSVVSISKSSCIKMLSAPHLTQKKLTDSIRSKNGHNSSGLFSANSLVSMSETQMFNRPLDAVSLASAAALSDTFMSEYEQRLNNSKIKLLSEVHEDWEALSQQISPNDSGQNSPQNMSNMEIQYQSEFTFNQVYHSPGHESNFELLPSEYHEQSATSNRSCVNDFRDSVDERISSQNLSLSLLTKQNHQIATQLQGLECYVREKMESAEDYVKAKLAQIEETNQAIVKALNELKRAESDENNQRQRVSQSVRSQRDKEPSQVERRKEPIRIDQSIRSQQAPPTDNRPHRLQSDKDPIQVEQHNKPTRIERDNEPIRPQQDRESIQNNKAKVETRPVTDVSPEPPVKQLRSTKELVMPKIPISLDFSLVILNIALRNADYMEQFVSEASRIVTLNAYNCRNSVRNVMTELFSINLLVKYRWSTRTLSSSNKPTFSSLTNVMRAISLLLINYMSAYDVRREIKAFFKEML